LEVRTLITEDRRVSLYTQLYIRLQDSKSGFYVAFNVDEAQLEVTADERVVSIVSPAIVACPGNPRGVTKLRFVS